MYNQKKYLAHKIGSILAMVLGGLILVSLIATIISVFKICDYLEGTALLGFLIGLTLRGWLGYTFIKFGRTTMDEPTLYKSENPPTSVWIYPSKKETITLIILGILLFILGIAASNIGGVVSIGGGYFVSIEVLEWAQWIQNLLSLGVAVLKIGALILPETGE